MIILASSLSISPQTLLGELRVGLENDWQTATPFKWRCVIVNLQVRAYEFSDERLLKGNFRPQVFSASGIAHFFIHSVHNT